MTKKESLLQEASRAIVVKKNGNDDWLAELKRKKHPKLPELLDLLDDWASGTRVHLKNHNRSSLARFLCGLEYCNRKFTGVVGLLRRLENGEVKTADYR